MRHSRRSMGWLGCALVAGLALPLGVHADERATSDELRAIADEAYVYAYPLVVLDATRRGATNVAIPTGQRAPINQFARVQTLPDASFTSVVMPNVDTLYTSAFLDLTKEPMVLHVPDTHDRYYLMPMLDAYTNVFASPGKRTTGTKEQDIAIVGPGWRGELPKGLTRVDAPTNQVWLLGRTQINGKEDLPKVTALTNEYTLAPLSSYGRPFAAPRNDHVDPNFDMKTPPPKIVAAMDARAFFARAAELMKVNPPPAADRAALARFDKIGLAPGRFAPSAAATEAMSGTPQRSVEKLRSHFSAIGKHVNGWRVVDRRRQLRHALSRSRHRRHARARGQHRRRRALHAGPEVDGAGAPLSGANRYVLHFAKGQEPPVNAFWSLTMYSPSGYLVANPVNRFAVGDRDNMTRNADGSLDILIQHDLPTARLAANWLPAPDGPFQLLLRMYWPKEAVRDGAWMPPAIKKAGAVANVPRRRI